MTPGDQRPRFFLVDAALDGVGGHYVDYAKEVLDAARLDGFETRLVTHRARSAPDIGHPRIGALSTTYLENFHSVAEDGTRLSRQALAIAFDWRIRMFGEVGVARLPVVLRRALTGMTMPAAMLAATMRRKFTAPMTRRADIIAKDLATMFATLPRELGAADIVFLPSATATDVLGVAQIQRISQHRPRWRILFRRDPDEEKVEDAGVLHRRQVRLARACSRIEVKDQVEFFTDTDALTERYSAICKWRFKSAPIPLRQVANAPVSPTKLNVIGYLGDARAEKGFARLPDIVAKAPAGVAFKVQSNFDGPVGELSITQRSLQSISSVQLLGGPHLADNYHQLFDQIDAVIIPYDRQSYARRSSGVFAESLAKAKPTIVTAGTWMADVLQDWEQAWLTGAAAPYSDDLKAVAVVYLKQEQPPAVYLRAKNSRLRTCERYPRPGGGPLHWVLDIKGCPDLDVIDDQGRSVSASIEWRSLPPKTPRSSVGLIAYDTTVAFAAAIAELDEFTEHYNKTAHAIAKSWARQHSGAALVSAIK